MSKPDPDPDAPRTVEAVDKACRIIDAIQSLDGAGITELADQLDISKGTVHTHLTTLNENGFVVKNGTTYWPSLRFLDIGEDIKNRRRLYQVATAEIDDLAAATDTRVQISVEEFGVLVVLAIAQSEHAIEAPTRVGKRDYLHCIASGKAILAHLPHERVEEIIDSHGLPARTPNTITDPDELFDELERVREDGIAFNDEEKIEGLRAVGAAIRSDTGEVLGSISASGPTSGMKGERFRKEIPEAVSNVANTTELNIRVEQDSTSDIEY
jgi:DNA-binding IclR family transcriptional regulator